MAPFDRLVLAAKARSWRNASAGAPLAILLAILAFLLSMTAAVVISIRGGDEGPVGSLGMTVTTLLLLLALVLAILGALLRFGLKLNFRSRVDRLALAATRGDAATRRQALEVVAQVLSALSSGQEPEPVSGPERQRLVDALVATAKDADPRLRAVARLHLARNGDGLGDDRLREVCGERAADEPPMSGYSRLIMSVADSGEPDVVAALLSDDRLRKRVETERARRICAKDGHLPWKCKMDARGVSCSDLHYHYCPRCGEREHHAWTYADTNDYDFSFFRCSVCGASAEQITLEKSGVRVRR